MVRAHCGHILAPHLYVFPAYIENYSHAGTSWGPAQCPAENIPHSQETSRFLVRFLGIQPSEQGEVSH